MNWINTQPSPDGTHHIIGGLPLYDSRFVEVLKFHEPGLAPALDASGAFHIDATGRSAYAERHERTFGFYENRAAVISGEGWYHIMPNGRPAYDSRFAWCGNFQSGRCPVRLSEGFYTHIDALGQAVPGQRWRYAGDYRDGIAVVQREDGLHTHVDTNGELVHNKWFVDLDVFHKGFARCRDEAGWMHVDRWGKPAYANRYAAVEPFYNGQARCERRDGTLEVIDATGRPIIELRPPRHDLFHERPDDMVGFWRTLTTGAASRLGTDDVLPATSAEVAKQCGVSVVGAGQLLHALAELGVVQLDGGMWSETQKRPLPEWQIPPWVVHWSDRIPADRPVGVLMRHSVRPPIPNGDIGNDLPITPRGRELARQIGELFDNRVIRVRSSPVLRCIQTANAIIAGMSDSGMSVELDRMLGDPGIFVTDSQAAWAYWQERGHENIMAHLAGGSGELPGLAEPAVAAKRLIEHLLSDNLPGLHLHITHDSLVTATAARALGIPLTKADWPWYLDAAFFWREGKNIIVAYRNHLKQP